MASTETLPASPSNPTVPSVAVESRAFPSWMAAETHEALNEAEPSARTSAVLEGGPDRSR